MPVVSCSDDGKPGFRWGDSGKCYTYASGDEASRERARERAERQGRAARAGGYRGMMKSEDWLGKPLYEELEGAEREFADALLSIAEKYGPLDREESGIYISYSSPEENDTADIGVKCGNCALVASENACAIFEQEIQLEGKCRLAVIPPGYVEGYSGVEKSAWSGAFLPVVKANV
jgi:hypothetical protein